jgi:hypothetical protein
LQAELDGSDTVQDLDYVSRYVDHFLDGQTIPDAETSYGIYTEIYNTITPDEVATAFDDLFASARRTSSSSHPTTSPIPRRTPTCWPPSPDCRRSTSSLGRRADPRRPN